MLYRKKPVVIEAFRWMNHDNEFHDYLGNDHMANWIGEAYKGISNEKLFIQTLEGLMTAHRGDWIVKGIQGEFYPIKPEIFEATYERVSTAAKAG